MESQNLKKAVRCVGGVFKLVTEALNPPQAGNVLVKTYSSTINPFDRTTYKVLKTEGNTIGADGCGVIDQVGEGVDSSLVGQKVIFMRDGFSNYAEKDPKELIYLNKDTDLSKVANGYVNPLTALGLLEII